MPITQIPKLQNNAKKQQKTARNSKYQIIVLQKMNKTSSNKSSTTALSLQSSQYTETSWSTKQEHIKSILEIKNSVQATP